jgi:hypothetical protein
MKCSGIVASCIVMDSEMKVVPRFMLGFLEWIGLQMDRGTSEKEWSKKLKMNLY